MHIRPVKDDLIVKLNIKFNKKERALKSPYYLCNVFWDQLDYNAQRASTCTLRCSKFTLALRKLALAKLKL